ncbi:MAG TPA: VOC family protein [Vicinamibacterales bacterium]|nr:VOC family protein [Vicinamibacterales bacterium]
MTNLDALLAQYEHGALSRRDLLAALALLVAAPAASAAQSATPIGAVKAMNHVTVFVPNVQKSVDFYQGLFGMPILTKQDAGINLNAGNAFYGIYPAPAAATGGSVNHVCFGMENFDADATLKQLSDRGVKGSIRLRGETKELYFTDPDGIRVQLQDVKYIGGTGVLGDKPPK